MRDSHVRQIVSALKQGIVTRSAESRAMASAARALRGDERHKKQMERRAFGRCTRWQLLAYTWLRSRPYARAEPHAVVPVEPYKITRVLAELGLTVDPALVRRWVRGETRGFEPPAELAPPFADLAPPFAEPAPPFAELAPPVEEAASCAVASTS